MTADRPAWRSASIARIVDGALYAGQEMAEETLLGPSKADKAAALAFRFSVSSPWTMPVAAKASSMFLWITLKAPA